jgi:hypothetical protein
METIEEINLCHLLNSQRITLELSTEYRFPQAKNTRKQHNTNDVYIEPEYDKGQQK